MDTFDEYSLLRFLSHHRQMPMARVSANFDTHDRRTETVAAPLIAKKLITATPFSSHLGVLDIMYQVRGWRVFTMQDPNYIERAIGFITEHGMLTGSQLHAMLDLDPDDMPSEVLAEALEDGRLIKEGKEWTLGAGPAAEVQVEVITYLPTAAAVLAFPVPDTTVCTAVDRVVEFLRMKGRATGADVRRVLNVARYNHPARLLQPGLDDGRLARSGPDWVLGDKERMAA